MKLLRKRGEDNTNNIHIEEETGHCKSQNYYITNTLNEE